MCISVARFDDIILVSSSLGSRNSNDVKELDLTTLSLTCIRRR